MQCVCICVYINVSCVYINHHFALLCQTQLTISTARAGQQGLRRLAASRHGIIPAEAFTGILPTASDSSTYNVPIVSMAIWFINGNYHGDIMVIIFQLYVPINIQLLYPGNSHYGGSHFQLAPLVKKKKLSSRKLALAPPVFKNQCPTGTPETLPKIADPEIHRKNWALTIFKAAAFGFPYCRFKKLPAASSIFQPAWDNPSIGRDLQRWAHPKLDHGHHGIPWAGNGGDPVSSRAHFYQP